MSERHHDPVADPLSPYWRAKVERAFASGLKARPRRRNKPNALTPLQRSVLAELRAGLSHAEIAAHRGLSVRTVRQIEGRGLARLRRQGA